MAEDKELLEGLAIYLLSEPIDRFLTGYGEKARTGFLAALEHIPRHRRVT
jgi:hypothetical protein